MRLHFTLEIEKEDLPIDYRRKILSYIIFCLEKSDSEFYQELYATGKNQNKEFSTSVYFVPQTKISKDFIQVMSKKIILNLSTPDAYLGIKIYNALCRQKYEWYKFSNNNSFKLIEILTEKEKLITQNEAVFHTLSPIVIRDHNTETGKDWFYTLDEDGAFEILKRNLIGELQNKFDRDISYDIMKLQIELKRMKKVIVKSYEFKIPASLATISLHGESYLLQYLYQRGLGSKRSMGFGYLELL